MSAFDHAVSKVDEFQSDVSQLVFIASFGGRAECCLIDALIERGRLPRLKRVVFADWYYTRASNKKRQHAPTRAELEVCRGVWARCCAEHGLELAVHASYVDLARDLRERGERAMLVAINPSINLATGSLRGGFIGTNREQDAAIFDVYEWAARERCAGPFIFIKGAWLVRATGFWPRQVGEPYPPPIYEGKYADLARWCRTTEWRTPIAAFDDAVQALCNFRSNATQIVFVESYVGRVQCAMIDALIKRGRVPNLRRVVFADHYYADPENFYDRMPSAADLEVCRGVWARCCAEHGLELAVHASYVDLERDLRESGERAMFVLVDSRLDVGTGEMRTGVDPEQNDALTRMWEWAARERCDAPFIFDGPVPVPSVEFWTVKKRCSHQLSNVFKPIKLHEGFNPSDDFLDEMLDRIFQDDCAR